MEYGYVRVSTKEQNEDRQMVAMREFGVKDSNVILDKQSGKDFGRPGYRRLVRKLKAGDTLVIKSIDRLGRNYDEILEQWHLLTKEKQVDIVVLDMPLLDTRQGRDLTGVLIADIELQLLSYVAQTEREFNRQRQAEGIAAAKARGVHFGRKFKDRGANYGSVMAAWHRGKLSGRAAERHPGDTAFQYREGAQIVSITYTKFKEDVNALSTYFLSQGTHGARMAIVGENSYTWIFAYFAVVLSGNIIVPLDKELPDEEIAALLIRCEAEVLIYSNAYADTAEKMLQEKRVNTIFNLKDFPVHLGNRDGRPILDSVDENAACSIIFTSGTTGKPKGVMLTQKNLMTDTLGACRNAKATGRSLLTLPLHHTFAFTTGVLAMLVYGVPICINKSLRTFMTDMQIFKPRIMILVPLYVETIHKNIWKTARAQGKERLLKGLIDTSNVLRRFGIDFRRKMFRSILKQFGGELNTIICGGAFLKQTYIDGMNALGIQILNGYGITECSPVVSVNRNQYLNSPDFLVQSRSGNLCLDASYTGTPQFVEKRQYTAHIRFRR